MILKQYIYRYMPEIFEKQQALSDSNINSIFGFDGLEPDDIWDGQYHKVIYDDNGNPIKIDDILHMDSRDFQKNYPFESAQAALKQYMKAYKIWSNKEIFNQCYNNIYDIKKKLERFKDVTNFDLMGIQL